jgi:hypothetical protein
LVRLTPRLTIGKKAKSCCCVTDGGPMISILKGWSNISLQLGGLYLSF